MVSLSDRDILTVLPLTFLSVIYWIRDRYMFNRSPDKLCKATKVQKYTLFILYPIWIFLNWIQGIQTKDNLVYALVTVTGAQTVGHLTSTSILNDTFLQTQQQIISSLYGLLISYVWCVYNYLVFSTNQQVEQVEYHNTTCQCNPKL